MSTPRLTTRAQEDQPIVSPNARWLAYTVNTGRNGVRVASLDDLQNSVQISMAGGQPVRWVSDGSRLFYLDGGAIWSVDLGANGPVLTSRRIAYRLPDDVQSADVMPDGSRALVVRGGGMFSDLVVIQGALK